MSCSTCQHKHCNICSNCGKRCYLKQARTKANYERWVFYNPELGSFIEKMPHGPNLLGMSAGLSLARAAMFVTEGEARSWESDVKQLNKLFRVTKVTLEMEPDKK